MELLCDERSGQRPWRGCQPAEYFGHFLRSSVEDIHLQERTDILKKLSSLSLADAICRVFSHSLVSLSNANSPLAIPIPS